MAKKKKRRLTNKQKAFTIEYPQDFNATQAAIRAGYSKKTAYSIGQENLKKPEIRTEIDRVLEARVMSRNEVLARLADQARADIDEVVDILDSGSFQINLKRAKAKGKTHLIKKLKETKAGPEVELYDAQAALVHLGRYYGLFTDKVEHTGSVENKLVILPDKDK